MNELAPYKNMMFNTIVRKNEALNQAHMAQEPIFVFRPESPGAQDYEQLTNEFINLCQT